jgi:cytosine deaminase
MTVSAITNAALLDREGLWTIKLQGERIAAVDAQPGDGGPTQPSPAHQGEVLDAGGGLVVPALVDPHLHLDLAYSQELVPRNRSGTLLEAIKLWAEAKSEISPDNVRDRAVRAIQDEVGFGTGFIRSHVDVGSSAGMRLCEGVLAARESTNRVCDIQLVAFPQDGLICDPPAAKLIRQACKAGVDLVGGIPHIERVPGDGLRHLQIVFDLASELDADIDVHIDETDDPASRYTEHLAAMTIERGWQGRVTASHVCALSSYDDAHAARVIDLLAEARIYCVTNPGVNLHLQGRFDGYPKRRGLTRVRELLEKGVKCGAGQDCIKDPFYPLGTGQMLDQAFLLVHAEHMNTPVLLRQAFDMVCRTAGEAIGLSGHEVAQGAYADLTIFPTAELDELLRLRPRPIRVLHKGAVAVPSV